MKKKSSKKAAEHFPNGLLKEMREQASPADKKLQQKARETARNASDNGIIFDSILSKVPKAFVRTLIEN